jgi:hypothetical protein
MSMTEQRKNELDHEIEVLELIIRNTRALLETSYMAIYAVRAQLAAAADNLADISWR